MAHPWSLLPVNDAISMIFQSVFIPMRHMAPFSVNMQRTYRQEVKENRLQHLRSAAALCIRHFGVKATWQSYIIHYLVQCRRHF